MYGHVYMHMHGHVYIRRCIWTLEDSSTTAKAGYNQGHHREIRSGLLGAMWQKRWPMYLLRGTRNVLPPQRKARGVRWARSRLPPRMCRRYWL